MKMFVKPSCVYLCSHYVDFRKSIDGLASLVEAELELSALSGALFVFCNKSRDKIKILYWDSTGFALWYKRLDKHKFKWPQKITPSMVITKEQLQWLLNGLDVIGHQPIDTRGKKVL